RDPIEAFRDGRGVVRLRDETEVVEGELVAWILRQREVVSGCGLVELALQMQLERTIQRVGRTLVGRRVARAAAAGGEQGCPENDGEEPRRGQAHRPDDRQPGRGPPRTGGVRP